MVGYVVTARNPVPRISLFLLDPKGSLRFAPGFHPTKGPFCALRAGGFHSNFLVFGPRTGLFPEILSTVVQELPRPREVHHESEVRH